MKVTEPGDIVMLIGGGQRPAIFRLEPQGEWQTHRGVLYHRDLIGIPWGSAIKTHLGYQFHVLSPTLHDILLHIRRKSQIIFPKDIGYILLRLSVGPGKTVIEAGTGSGALTTALAWAVGHEGRIFSYDRREDMQELARSNLARLGLESRVTFIQRDAKEGFLQTDVDAVFLDLHDPHEVLQRVRCSLTPGGAFGAIVPTTNQVSALVGTLERQGFAFIEALEILHRFYKPLPERLRPMDRMVAHTGFLVFARPLFRGSSESEAAPLAGIDSQAIELA